MTNSIKFGALFLGILLIPVIQSFTSTTAASKAPTDQVDSMSLVQIADGVYELSWSPMEGTDPYRVTVTDLTTNTLHSQFSTYNTSATIENVIRGHRYNYALARQEAMQNLQEE